MGSPSTEALGYTPYTGSVSHTHKDTQWPLDPHRVQALLQYPGCLASFSSSWSPPSSPPSPRPTSVWTVTPSLAASSPVDTSLLSEPALTRPGEWAQGASTLAGHPSTLWS